MTPEAQEYERKNNRIFWIAMGVLVLVAALMIANRDPAEATRSKAQNENWKACADRAMRREYYQGRSPSEDDIERIAVACHNANN